MELKVTGMTCGGCVNAVTRAIKGQDKSAIVAVDLASGVVRVEGSITPAQAADAVRAAGFELAAS